MTYKLNQIIEELGTLLKYEAYGVVNMMLSKGIRYIPTMPEEKILAYARTTYAVREKLSVWKKFVSAAESEFAKRGLDSKSLLKGLIP